jgi:hypothetical protein
MELKSEKGARMCRAQPRGPAVVVCIIAHTSLRRRHLWLCARPSIHMFTRSRAGSRAAGEEEERFARASGPCAYTAVEDEQGDDECRLATASQGLIHGRGTKPERARVRPVHRPVRLSRPGLLVS